MKATGWNGQWRFGHLGAYTQQNPKAFDLFKIFFEQNKFDLMIEIGTANGGLSMFLKDECDKIKCFFETYDIKKENVKKLNENQNFKKRKINAFAIDILDSKVVESIGHKIKTSGRVLVLCDGGDKVREFKTYSAFLKKNDVIMAHDYADDEEEFENNIKGKVWNWHEIRHEDIREACESHGLEDYMPEFRSAAWVCKIKSR